MNKDDLKQFRERLGMSQQAVALLLGMSQPAWNLYETGKRAIPEYITREIEFFQALSNRSQTYFINRIANKGLQRTREDSRR